jgi:glycosyltransferase involved in cell wall biosynthesis
MSAMADAGAKEVVAQAPLVSAIIIFLDAERFIEEAIESVLAQTCGAWVLLLVDDGSSDAGTNIARRYAARHPDRMRYLEHPGHANRGMSAARNLGIANARGAYVAFLDADDVWLPQRLERHVDVLEREPDLSAVYGPSRYCSAGKPASATSDRAIASLTAMLRSASRGSTRSRPRPKRPTSHAGRPSA